MTNLIKKKRIGPFQKAIDCKDGCIFTEPIFGGIANIYDYNKYNDNIRKFIPKNCEDRLHVLLNTLMIEDKISRLKQIIEGNRNNIFTLDVMSTERGRFIDTCDYIKSFKLIPNHLLEISKRVYKIRNKFMHDLECNNFDFLNKKYSIECALLLNTSNEFKNISEYLPLEKKLTKEIFDKFIFLCDAGINSYLFAVELWKKDQSSKDLEYYKNIASKLNEDEERVIFENIPQINYENGTKVERFPKGVVRVNGDYNIK